MKIQNTGQGTFIVTDVRGNRIALEQNDVVEVSEKTAAKLKRIKDYSFIKFIEEAPVAKEVKEEVKKEEVKEEVIAEPNKEMVEQQKEEAKKDNNEVDKLIKTVKKKGKK